jgi:hypothetical protein
MEDTSIFEYSCEQKSYGKWKFIRILTLSLYIIYVLAYFLIIYITRIFPLGALIPVTLWIIVYFTWHLTKPEYKYTVGHGYFTFYKVGRKKDKKQVEFKISSAKAICPAGSISLKDYNIIKTYSALPQAVCNDAYIAIFEEEGRGTCAIYFVATEGALKLLHLYNSKTVTVKTTY